MNKYGEFKRDCTESEKHLGERMTRPMVSLGFGGWYGQRYQGEWARNEDGYLDLHGWGILISKDGC